MQLKIMTYNIAGGRYYSGNGNKGVFSPDKCLEAIKEIKPDICSLNEVDKGLSRSQRIDLLDYLSKGTEMNSYFGAAIFFDGGEYGNGLLSRFPILRAEIIMIPDPAEKIGSRFETRCIIKAILNTGKEKICVLVTHFGLNKSEQENAVNTLVDIIDGENMPVILLGDFNVTPDDPVLKPLYDRLNSAGKMLPHGTCSFPSYDVPEEKRVLIDYIFLSSCIKVKKAEIPTLHVSDHNPMICEIEF